MSPVELPRKHSDGRTILLLDTPAVEVNGSGKMGDKDRVLLVEFTKDGFRNMDIAWRKDVVREEHHSDGFDSKI